MKKIFVLFNIILLVACGDSFLEESPITIKVDKNFYATEQDVYEALVGCYKILQWEEYGSYWHIAETASDNVFLGTGAQEGKIGWDDWLDYNDENLCDEFWERCYMGIFRCNSLLVNTKPETFTNVAVINKYIAEARFLRAYYYFDLIRVFGNIPLFDKPEFDKYRKQASPEEVYTFIATDLKYAIENIPALRYESISPSESGRVTKWAAEALMARVYLYYTGYYAKPDLVGIIDKVTVTGYINDVIESSGHGLVDDFRALWGYALNESYLEKLTGNSDLTFAGENNKEIVFAIKFSETGIHGKYDGSHWIVYNGYRSYAKDPVASGWGFATVNPKLWNAYRDDDLRKKGSIIDMKADNVGYTAIDQNEYTGYWQTKYIPVAIDNTDRLTALERNWQYGQPYDFYVIRFADVLLMGAELNLDTDPGKAQIQFDMVRNRAFGGAAPAETVSKEAIMEERRLELAFEGIRYWDLLRQGLDVAKSALDEPGVEVYTGGLGEDKIVTKVISFPLVTKGLFQIPNDEIKLSEGTLIQNAGW
ncbi:MAG: RagB/SusD family nutrient uptake outer membrane protein [Bacteroidales bacterium]|nr:RagB/SusD family nutrient uptake outer membrane protein [Bacteroidales bacterium]